MVRRAGLNYKTRPTKNAGIAAHSATAIAIGPSSAADDVVQRHAGHVHADHPCQRQRENADVELREQQTRVATTSAARET
ncbi:MAG: hypothetical protein EHM55_14965 [Acidobacteria bacterium]|nr:MAG: hypothetical protein EHM55_14965 [Acidobacteriota bacterium]